MGKLRALAALAAVLAACGPSSEDAVQAVKLYDQRLVEAYRTADARLLADVAGPAEHKKVTALIGVKSDQGVTLDSRLLSMEVKGVRRDGDGFLVDTHERWQYLDRRIGSGEQVAQDSSDEYDLRYRVGRIGKRLVVNAVEFTKPPVVGRTEVPGGVPSHFGATIGGEREGGAR